MKKHGQKAGILVGITALVTMLFGATAFANPSTASATCQGGIVYEGHDYPSAGNTVTVKIDNVTVAGFPKTFGSSTSGTVPFPNKTQSHTWSVIWDRFNGTDGDRTQSGSVEACQTVPTTTTVAPTTTIAATTTTVPQSTTTVVVNTQVIVPTTTIVDPTTTVPTRDTTTTTVVDVCNPPQPGAICGPATVPNQIVTTTAVGTDISEQRILPRTGPKDWLIPVSVAAIMFFMAGCSMLLARRK